MQLHDVLDTCLEKISKGCSRETCLADYPQLHHKLDILLEVAKSLLELPKLQPSTEFIVASKTRLLSRFGKEYKQVKNKETNQSTFAETKVAVQSHKASSRWGNKRVTLTLLLASLVSVVSLLVLSVLGIFPSQQSIAAKCMLNNSVGDVQVQTEDSEAWYLVMDEIELRYGTRIRTAADATATITFTTGSTVILGSDTDITIEQLTHDDKVQSSILINQLMGSILCQVETIDDGSFFQVNTPSVNVTAQGTLFMIEVSEGSTDIHVEQGSVVVEANNEIVVVSMGYSCTVQNGSSPGVVALAADEGRISNLSTESSITQADFELNLISGTGGTISSPGAGILNYDQDSIVTISAEPNSGYVFAGWIGDVADPDSPNTTINMDSDKTVTATFTESVVTLTINSGDNGSVSLPGEGSFTYVNGAITTIRAIADVGYSFSNWSGAVDTVSNIYDSTTEIIIDADYSVTANFAPLYKVNIISSSGGTITEPGEGSFDFIEGTLVTISAVADEGWRFTGWTGNVDDPNSPDTTVFIDGDKTVTATFSPGVYTLSIEIIGNGSTTPDAGTYSFAYGTQVSVSATASPEQNFKFTGWTGNVDDPNSPDTTVLINGDKVITATFSELTPTLTINSGANGTVIQPGEGAFTYGYGSTVTLRAVPNPGHSFLYWGGDTDSVVDIYSDDTSIILNHDCTVTAFFTPTHVITISSSSGGSVNQPGEGSFNFPEGEVVYLEALPEEGYRFDTWSGDISTLNNIYSATSSILIDADYIILANFIAL